MVEHCVCLVSIYSIQIISISTKLDVVNILRLLESMQASQNSNKTTAERIKKSIVRTIGPHHRLGVISGIYPIKYKVDKYLTALLTVISWHQIPWTHSRFSIGCFILPQRSLEVCKLLVAHMKIFGGVELFLGPKFSGKAWILISTLQ